MELNNTARKWRWVWLAGPMVAMMVALWVGGEARATTAGPDQTEAQGRVNLPIVIDAPLVPPQIKLVPFVNGFENKSITVITHAGDERLFIANREGKIWIVNPNGSINAGLFLDISTRVRYQDNFEQGLLGLAFHPDFPNTPYYYVAYTTTIHLEIARGVVNPATPNVSDAKSLQVFMRIRKPDASGGASPVHNAGDLTFGPDGYLYIPIGDGGPDPYDPMGVPGDPNNNSQRRDNLLGSILRVDPDPTRGLPPDCGTSNLYSIPRDNPWLNDDGCDEIWSMGLRNPWRISIDPLNGDMYIADVGEWIREEIDFIPGNSPGGYNFGWHCWEGTLDYSQVAPEYGPACSKLTNVTFPVHEYGREPNRCSVIGGKIYRGSKYPSLYGHYFFGDWCSGELWTMVREDGQFKVEKAGLQRILFTTFGEDVHGELYGAGYANGTLYKIEVK